MQEYLVVLEVSQKQNYIFKTDRLIENIGASIIIREVTEEIPAKYSEEDEFVFEGGGKSVYAFKSEDLAKRFVSNVSRDVLENYPGLELFMTIHGYDSEVESVIDAINELYGKLEQKKSARRASFKLFGLGINEECQDTSMPATKYEYFGKTSVMVSREVAVKIKSGREKQDIIYSELLPDKEKYVFAHEFEELGGSKGTKNYISIVVIDGNKMGKKIEKIREDFISQHTVVDQMFNDSYKKELRKLSESIDESYKNAVGRTIKKLADNLEIIKKESGIEDNYSQNDEKIILPIRPLIMAGDDICLVTDSRIGINVAEDILDNIEKERIKGLPMKACAGVAIVKTGYPFFRAHELAEELCHNAKSILPTDDSMDASVIDFHLDQGELIGSLSMIRKELYQNSSLTNKPLFLHSISGSNITEKKSMDYLRNRLLILGGKDIGRGFIKKYRDALYGGEKTAKKYLSDKRQENLKNGSYEKGHCIDFDAIEILDIYNRLEG